MVLISPDLHHHFYGFYLVRKVAIENLSCGLWLAIRETQTVETGNYFDHRQCTLHVQYIFLHAWWKRKKCGKIWQSLNVCCSANLIYKHKRNPELLVFWLVAHERNKSTHTCTCLPAQRQIMSNLILLLILFYVGHMYEVISSYIFG